MVRWGKWSTEGKEREEGCWQVEQRKSRRRERWPQEGRGFCRVFKDATEKTGRKKKKSCVLAFCPFWLFLPFGLGNVTSCRLSFELGIKTAACRNGRKDKTGEHRQLLHRLSHLFVFNSFKWPFLNFYDCRNYHSRNNTIGWQLHCTFNQRSLYFSGFSKGILKINPNGCCWIFTLVSPVEGNKGLNMLSPLHAPNPAKRQHNRVYQNQEAGSLRWEQCLKDKQKSYIPELTNSKTNHQINDRFLTRAT